MRRKCKINFRPGLGVLDKIYTIIVYSMTVRKADEENCKNKAYSYTDCVTNVMKKVLVLLRTFCKYDF